MTKAKNLVGQKFGRLTVVSRNYEYQQKLYEEKGVYKAFWNCKCDCGNEVIIYGPLLLNGNTKSCGCYAKEKQKIQKNTKNIHWDIKDEITIGTTRAGDKFIIDTNMYELACKTNAELDLTDSEKVTVSQLDAYFKKVGERGTDPEHEIAAFVRKAINEEIYSAPDELLDFLFNRDNIGEFDDFEGVTDPKNTLVAYETAKGANVKRSFLDIGVLTPQFFNLQIETDISYKDLRKNGWKSVATITEYAVATFKNKMFKIIFDKIDAGIANGAENYLNVGGAAMTQAASDALALYVNDRADGDGVIVGKSAYIQQINLGEIPYSLGAMRVA